MKTFLQSTNLIIVSIKQDDVILSEVVQWGSGGTPPVVVEHHLKMPDCPLLPSINGLLHLVGVGIVDGVLGTSHNKAGSMTEPKAQSPPKAQACSEKPNLAD